MKKKMLILLSVFVLLFVIVLIIILRLSSRKIHLEENEPLVGPSNKEENGYRALYNSSINEYEIYDEFGEYIVNLPDEEALNQFFENPNSILYLNDEIDITN